MVWYFIIYSYFYCHFINHSLMKAPVDAGFPFICTLVSTACGFLLCNSSFVLFLELHSRVKSQEMESWNDEETLNEDLVIVMAAGTWILALVSSSLLLTHLLAISLFYFQACHFLDFIFGNFFLYQLWNFWRMSLWFLLPSSPNNNYQMISKELLYGHSKND